jgi:hypothetical protein
MENYSLAICRNSPEEVEPISWQKFGETLRKLKCQSAKIYAVDPTLSIGSLILRQSISDFTLKENKVRHLSEYVLISHDDGYQAMPCIVLLDPDENYFTRGLILASKHKNHIDVQFRPDGSLSVSDCDFVIKDFFPEHLMN